MKPKISYTYWQDGDLWIGYLDEYSDYWTQGSSMEDLQQHLLDLHKDLSNGLVPNIRHHAELEFA